VIKKARRAKEVINRIRSVALTWRRAIEMNVVRRACSPDMRMLSWLTRGSWKSLLAKWFTVLMLICFSTVINLGLLETGHSVRKLAPAMFFVTALPPFVLRVGVLIYDEFYDVSLKRRE